MHAYLWTCIQIRRTMEKLLRGSANEIIAYYTFIWLLLQVLSFLVWTWQPAVHYIDGKQTVNQLNKHTHTPNSHRERQCETPTKWKCWIYANNDVAIPTANSHIFCKIFRGHGGCSSSFSQQVTHFKCAFTKFARFSFGSHSNA